MLRWIGLSAFLCVAFVCLGLGQGTGLSSGVQSFFLAMAALSATVLISSYDAWETQVTDRPE